MKNFANNFVIKIMTVFLLVGLGYASAKIDPAEVFSGDAYVIYARFNSVAGLKIGHPVKMLGLKIGRIAGFKMDQENQVALAKLKIKDDIKIYDDAFASIKMESLIGENYINIDPGGSGYIMQTGETITDTESLIDIGELIGKYAFGDTLKYQERDVRLALNRDGENSDWLD